jgi:hypothetical protein
MHVFLCASQRNSKYILIGKRSKSSKSCREEYPVHFAVSLALLDIFELFSTALSQLENFCTYFDQTLYWSSLNVSLISYTTFMRQNQSYHSRTERTLQNCCYVNAYISKRISFFRRSAVSQTRLQASLNKGWAMRAVSVQTSFTLKTVTASELR